MLKKLAYILLIKAAGNFINNFKIEIKWKEGLLNHCCKNVNQSVIDCYSISLSIQRKAYLMNSWFGEQRL